MFPIHQAAFLLGLGCTLACFNDDNKDLVAFARQVSKSLRQRRDIEIARMPYLIDRMPGRLNSWDDRRMAKKNRNYLPIDASRPEVIRFARKLVGSAVPPGEAFDSSRGSEIEGVYAKLIGADADRMLKLGGHERLDALAEHLWLYIDRIQRRRAENVRVVRESGFLGLITTHEAAARDRIESILDEAGAWH